MINETFVKLSNVLREVMGKFTIEDMSNKACVESNMAIILGSVEAFTTTEEEQILVDVMEELNDNLADDLILYFGEYFNIVLEFVENKR